MPFYEFDGKQVFYSVHGRGDPLLLLHGNTAASGLFRSEASFYSKSFTVITPDFPGHGRSERLAAFPDDYWHMNAQATAALCQHLNLTAVKVIGTSGGGLTGLNMAVARPDLIQKLIVDSVNGNRLSVADAGRIIHGRAASARNPLAVLFWFTMHGRDWKKIVRADSELLMRVAQQGARLVKGDLSTVRCPVLFTGSTDDELIPDLEQKTRALAREVGMAQVRLFPEGKHPFMLTRKRIFRELALEFLND